MERWVVNASPIICLAKAGYSDLLLKLTDEIIVPQTVVEEIQAGHLGDPAEQILATGQFPVAEIPAMAEILAWDLGKGETAVLSYALANLTWIAIIDDLAARKCARSFSIPVKGTLAVVILAKKRYMWRKSHNFHLLPTSVILLVTNSCHFDQISPHIL